VRTYESLLLVPECLFVEVFLFGYMCISIIVLGLGELCLFFGKDYRCTDRFIRALLWSLVDGFVMGYL
jgi:hypothetical protein